MQETLDLIYSDTQINTYETMVPGSDLCDILGLFFDLAESMEVKHTRQKDALEKYKKAYNNKVKREKREKEKGVAEEDDPRFKNLQEANTKLTQENEERQKELEEVKENLEVLLIDNDEKEAKIKELITDLNIKSATIENLMQGLTQATAESDQNTKKAKELEMKAKTYSVEKDLTERRLVAIKMEKDLKEKEAANHLAEIETKAARVDELEKQHVLLEMDKDRLKSENGRLIDQLRATGNPVNTEFLRAQDRAATLFGGKRDLNKYNNRQS